MTPNDARPELRIAHVVLSTTLFVGCTGSTDDTSDDLPVDDTGVTDTGEPWEFVDTGGGDTLDEAPLNTLTLRQWGAFTLAPGGGPYTSLTGDLFVQEYLDGVRPDTADTEAEPVVLDCDVAMAVSGVPFTGTPCPTCDFAFRVEFALVSGDPALCHDPELPRHQDEWTVGWDPDGRLVRDWGDAGLWLTWFDADLDADVLSFLWEVTVGVAVEEEDE